MNFWTKELDIFKINFSSNIYTFINTLGTFSSYNKS